MQGIQIFMQLLGTQQVQSGANRVAGSFGRIEAAAMKAKVAASVALAGVATGLAAAAAEGVKYNAQQEQMLISFETLLGSQRKARAFVDYLAKAGAATPFETTDLASASRTLLGFGYTAKETKSAIDDMGNAVSALGGGGAELQGLSLIFGQIKAKGRLQGEEVLQLAERGIAAQDMLTKSLGLSADEFQKRLSAGKIDADTAIDALLGSFAKKYAGSMEKQSQTLLGKWSTFQDNAKMKLGEWTKPLAEGLRDKALPMATEQLGKIPTYVEKIKSTLAPVGTFLSGIGKGLASAGKDAKPFWDNVLGPFLKGAGKGLLVTLAVAFKVFQLAAQGLGKVLGFIGKVAGKLGLGSVFEFLGSIVGGLVAGPFAALIGKVSVIGKVISWVMKPLGWLTKGIGWLLTGAGNLARAFGGPVVRALGNVAKFFGGVLDKAKALLGPLEWIYDKGKDLGLWGGGGKPADGPGTATTPKPAPSMVPGRSTPKTTKKPATRLPSVSPLFDSAGARQGLNITVHPQDLVLEGRVLARSNAQVVADEKARR